MVMELAEVHFIVKNSMVWVHLSLWDQQGMDWTPSLEWIWRKR